MVLSQTNITANFIAITVEFYSKRTVTVWIPVKEFQKAERSRGDSHAHRPARCSVMNTSKR